MSRLIETGMTKPVFDRARQRGTDGKIGQLNPLSAPASRTNSRRWDVLASDDASTSTARRSRSMAASRVDAVCGKTDLGPPSSRPPVARMRAR